MSKPAASRRSYRRRWLDMLGPASFAAFSIAVLEVLFVAAMVPAAPSDVLGLALEGSMTLALFGACAVAWSLPLALVGKPRAKRWLTRSSGGATFALGWSLLALVPLAALRSVFDTDWQFPRDVNAVYAMLALGALFCVLALAHFVSKRFAAALTGRLPWRLRRNAAALILAIAAATAVVASHLFLQPEYLVYECGVAGAVGILLATVAACAALPRPRRARDAGAPALLLVASVATWFVPGASAAHARFLLWNHGALAAPMAKVVRDVLDRDGDASAPTWLAGTDCAEGNPRVGPLLREIPGDGIDQDCRGGDAPVLPPPPAATFPPSCHLPDGKLSVLLLTIDALRADRTTRDTLPALFALAGRSTVFTSAHSPTALTITSMSALLAARPVADMVDNALTDGDMRVTATVPELFHAAGWRTAAFNSFGELHPIQRRGFDSFNDQWMDAFPQGAESMLTSRALAREAVAFMEGSDAPFLAWVHFSDVHSPYKFDRGPHGRRSQDQSYDLGVAYVGRALDGLFAVMAERRLFDRTIVVVTADHGEELMARGREGHGADLFEEVTHVPLVLWVPGCSPHVSTQPVGTIQIGPTLGALAGVPVPGWGLFDARPLPVVTEATVGYDVQFKRAVVGRRYKLIIDVANGGRMLFDLAADPGEAVNIYGTNAQARATMEGEYQRWLDAPGAR